jgi:hypothetical protein
MANMRPKPMMKSSPKAKATVKSVKKPLPLKKKKVNVKALNDTRMSDKKANPKSPRNLRDIKFTKDRLKMEAGVRATQKKNAKNPVLGGDTY